MSDRGCREPAQDAGSAGSAATAPTPVPVEILYFDGCPNHHSAIALVERASRELGIEPELQLINVPDHEAAQKLRFLGSPTIRVGGRDVDPHTEERRDYALSCRVFRTEKGVAGQPAESWVLAALLRETSSSGTGSLVPAVEAALEAAASPTARRGSKRSKRLSHAERAMYEWILRMFAAGTPPTPTALARAAAAFGVDIQQALATLAAEDLVHRDAATGSILVAYPFSATPRGHSVRIDDKQWVEAMCAIDALGIEPMLGLPIEVFSHDPLSGGEVWGCGSNRAREPGGSRRKR